MSRVSARASSSRCSTSRSAKRWISAPRSAKPIRGHGPSSNARRAAVTARSASAAPPSATVAHGSRVHGSTESNVAPSDFLAAVDDVPERLHLRLLRRPLCRQLDRDVDDHVLLAADVARARRSGAGSRARAPCSARPRARRAAGTTSRPRPSPARSRCGPSWASACRYGRTTSSAASSRPIDVEAGVDAEPVEHRGEHLGGRVARTRAERAQRAVDLADPDLVRDHRVGHAEATGSGGRGSRPTPRRRPRATSASNRARAVVACSSAPAESVT